MCDIFQIMWIWLGSCNHCSLACFIFTSKFWIFFIKPQTILLSFIMTWTLPSSFMIFSPVFSQSIFMSSLSCKFSQAANLFEILNRFCSLTSTSLKFSKLNLYTWNFYAAPLITDSLSLSFATTRQWSVSDSFPPREIGH